MNRARASSGEHCSSRGLLNCAKLKLDGFSRTLRATWAALWNPWAWRTFGTEKKSSSMGVLHRRSFVFDSFERFPLSANNFFGRPRFLADRLALPVYPFSVTKNKTKVWDNILLPLFHCVNILKTIKCRINRFQILFEVETNLADLCSLCHSWVKQLEVPPRQSRSLKAEMSM